jgi:hypothetical protein
MQTRKRLLVTMEYSNGEDAAVITIVTITITITTTNANT